VQHTEVWVGDHDNGQCENNTNQIVSAAHGMLHTALPLMVTVMLPVMAKFKSLGMNVRWGQAVFRPIIWQHTR